jgi:hypothetical protein
MARLDENSRTGRNCAGQKEMCENHEKLVLGAMTRRVVAGRSPQARIKGESVLALHPGQDRHASMDPREAASERPL